MAPLLPVAAYTSSHNVRLVYDNVVCESNPRRLFKLHFQATFLKDLLSLKRFQFVYCLYNKDDYVVDWELTWFALNFFPAHDASFQASHAARHYTFKFKLFLDDLPLLEKLKITRSDLQSAMKVVAAIHNNFIQKFRKRIWNSRTYDKSKWEDAMNITLKLKTTPRPSNLPATSYVPFSSLPPLTHLVTPRNYEVDWIKNSMTQGLPWFKHLSGFMDRLTVLFNNSFCRIGCRFL
ncbi:hypothetical protein RclHR1_12140014 [Rhizophagus clarus]|uniref:Uncharacterized protein n=1 Tax=Rhizophagus clarus TaxID=94130 RepID=A0A2Z6Q7V9_9GLOM|nr:hypothetical protein RclHR1_12140014 [Rhizophagus clarus]